jgi:hypothetical protein
VGLLAIIAIVLAAAFPPTHSEVRNFKYVAIVVEENRSYETVIGNPDVPYMNSLAQDYSLLANHYANIRGSVTDYLIMTSGLPLTRSNTTTEIFDVDNIFRRLIESNMTWKVYAQSLPFVGFTGYTPSGPYLKRHNPATYFTDSVSLNERINIVPSEQLAEDIANNSLPNFMLIIPDADHDAHDGSLATADSWLKSNIEPLLQNPTFQKDGLLIITWDEGNEGDERHGGGRIPTIFVGPQVKSEYKSFRFYQHEHLLRTLCEIYGFESCPGKAQQVNPINDVFRN